MRRDVAVVILAGGEGARIGGGKPLRRLRGERLIDCALRQAAGWSDAIAVAVRNPVQIGTVGAPIILDEPDIAGPLGGVVAALRFAKDAGRVFVLTIPADMPFLPEDLLDRLLIVIGNSGCALASSGGHVHPVCGLWQTSALDEVGRYLVGERRSLRGFAELIGHVSADWPVEPVDPFLNVNTAEDLARAEALAAR
jgi:molybdopterin-guanine dinucleotide biosynthesis protein A